MCGGSGCGPRQNLEQPMSLSSRGQAYAAQRDLFLSASCMDHRLLPVLPKDLLQFGSSQKSRQRSKVEEVCGVIDTPQNVVPEERNLLFVF